jgi:hypothetical protein
MKKNKIILFKGGPHEDIMLKVFLNAHTMCFVLHLTHNEAFWSGFQLAPHDFPLQEKETIVLSC